MLDELLNRDRDVDDREPFIHEAQSLRVVDLLSTLSGHDYVGLNLTYEVRDGIRCHCGESIDQFIRPRDRGQVDDPSVFVGRAILPITMEGCVVRMADRVAYLGRDYEDAQIALGGLLPALPAAISGTLGTNNREIINTLATDLIRESQRDPACIGFSDAVFTGMSLLREFNYEHIYLHDKLEEYRSKIDDILARIFDVLCEFLSRRPKELWAVSEPDWPMHLEALSRFIRGSGYDILPDPTRVVVDYLSLMTDGFAFKVYKSIALPAPVV